MNLVRTAPLVFLLACLSSCSRCTTPPAPAARPGPEVVWTFEPPERGAIVSSPAVAGDRVYAGTIHSVGLSTSGVVYCLDRDSGRVVWKFDDDGRMQHMYSSPCLAEGRLYIGEGMHANHVCKLYCLDAATGRRLWDFETAGHVESSPCVAAGGVLFGAGDDGVYCLDARTGERCWHFEGPRHVDSNLAVAGDRVFGGSGISRIYQRTEAFCLDLDTGKPLWQRPTSLPAWGSPAVDGDEVFYGLGNGRLTEPVAPPQKPAGAVLCLDARTGAERWRYEVGDGVLAQPILDPDHVYFGCRDGYVYSLDRRGQLGWRQALGSPVVTRLAPTEGRVYAVASGGQVACFDAADGRPLWTFDVARHSQTTPQLFSSPAVVAEAGPDGPHRRIYFGAELKNPVSSAAVLYCLRD